MRYGFLRSVCRHCEEANGGLSGTGSGEPVQQLCRKSSLASRGHRHRVLLPRDLVPDYRVQDEEQPAAIVRLAALETGFGGQCPQLFVKVPGLPNR